MLTVLKRETLENWNSYTDHIVPYMGEVTNLKPEKGQGKVLAGQLTQAGHANSL